MPKLERTSFEEALAQLVAPPDAPDRPSPAPAEGLHVCEDCGSMLVHPVWCTDADDDSWQVALRCPSCEAFRVGRFGQAHIDELDRELDRGEAALQAALARLTHANMADIVDRFVRALAADAIQPSDF